MITDRISIQLALINLRIIESNEGTVSNILLSVRSNNSNISKSAKFPNIATLESFISQFVNLTTFTDLECTKFSLYELKSFIVSNQTTSNNFIYNNEGTWETKYPSINNITIHDLNTRYLKDFNDVYIELASLFPVGQNKIVLISKI